MTCPTCNEDYMACDRYGCWKTVSSNVGRHSAWQAGRVDSAAILDNSQAKPKYSLAVTYLIGAVILVCMGTGIYLGVRFGY